LTSSATFNFRSSERRNAAVAATVVLVSSAGLAAAARGPRVDRPLIVFDSVRVPELCLFHRATGRHCPGCGMSRAFVLLWHGQLREAVRSNPASPFVFATLVWLALRPMAHMFRGFPGRAVGYGRPTPDVAVPAESSVPTKTRSQGTWNSATQ